MKRTIALLALALLPSLAAAAPCLPFVPNVTKNCTTEVCTIEACWPAPMTTMTGCVAYITAPGGPLPAITGTPNAALDLCTVVMPKLISGNHSIQVKGVNVFGEGQAMPVPLALTTGTPPDAPSGVVLK